MDTMIEGIVKNIAITTLRLETKLINAYYQGYIKHSYKRNSFDCATFFIMW
ncbi:MAG: hypothetical protein QXP55_01195 [Nitrososphaerales archaeon]